MKVEQSRGDQGISTSSVNFKTCESLFYKNESMSKYFPEQELQITK